MSDGLHQVQVWQGDFDTKARIWRGTPTGPRAESGYLPTKKLAFLFAGEMAKDLGCVAIIPEKNG